VLGSGQSRKAADGAPTAFYGMVLLSGFRNRPGVRRFGLGHLLTRGSKSVLAAQAAYPRHPPIGARSGVRILGESGLHAFHTVSCDLPRHNAGDNARYAAY
jgi:hypothetical protein